MRSPIFRGLGAPGAPAHGNQSVKDAREHVTAPERTGSWSVGCAE